MTQIELREPEDDSDLKLLSDVRRVGWHVVGIAADPEEDLHEYAFSVGLFHSFDHPEIAIYGLRNEIALQLINLMGIAVRHGASFSHGDTTKDIAEGFALTFIDFDPIHYEAELGYARWFYRGDGFPALQCVWPDKKGQFPWETQRSNARNALQPIWGNPP